MPTLYTADCQSWIRLLSVPSSTGLLPNVDINDGIDEGGYKLTIILIIKSKRVIRRIDREDNLRSLAIPSSFVHYIDYFFPQWSILISLSQRYFMEYQILNCLSYQMMLMFIVSILTSVFIKPSTFGIYLTLTSFYKNVWWKFYLLSHQLCNGACTYSIIINYSSHRK